MTSCGSCRGTAIRPATCTTGMSAFAKARSRRFGRYPHVARHTKNRRRVSCEGDPSLPQVSPSAPGRALNHLGYAVDTTGDVKAMIANLERPEMRTLIKMLARRAWRIHPIRWLLRVRGAS